MTTIALDANGWHIATPNSITTSDFASGSLAQILDRAAAAFGADGDGVLILSAECAVRAGYPRECPRDRAAVTLDAGQWHCPRVGSWSTWQHPTSPRLCVMVAEWVRADHARSNPLADPADLIATAYRHEWFREATGIRFAYSAGGSMCDWVVRHCRFGYGRRPAWRDAATIEVVEGSPSVVPWRWQSDRAVTSGWVHQWDKNASFLGTLGNVQVAVGMLSRTGAMEFDPALAGMWQIIPGPAPVDGLPHPAGMNLPAGKPVWLPTATMRLLDEEGCCPDVLDSWTCPEKRALFKPLKDRWNAARVELKSSRDPDAQAVLAAVKAGYSAGVNQFGTPREFIVRPDWRAEIIGLDKANVWRATRKAAAQGWWPLALRVDAVWYACDSDTPQCPPNLREDPVALGAWKHAGATPAAEWGVQR